MGDAAVLSRGAAQARLPLPARTRPDRTLYDRRRLPPFLSDTPRPALLRRPLPGLHTLGASIETSPRLALPSPLSYASHMGTQAGRKRLTWGNPQLASVG